MVHFVDISEIVGHHYLHLSFHNAIFNLLNCELGIR